METRRFLIRGAIAFGLAISVAGTSVVVPSAQAMALSHASGSDSVVMKKKDGKSEEEDGEGGGNIMGNIPIIGDAVGGLRGNSPKDTIRNVLETLDGIADSVVPSLLGGK